MLDLNAKRFAEARDRLREAIICQKKALDAFPRHPRYRQFLVGSFANLLRAAHGLDDDALASDAHRGIDELRDSDPRIQVINSCLAAVLKGDAPKDNAERLELGQRAYETKRYATAAALWGGALAADPGLTADRQAQHRYNAACVAALAASGRGEGEPAPDDAAKNRLRRHALDWLTSELAVWVKLIESGPPQARPAIVQALRHWKEDTDLAGVRDGEALAALPEPERKEWLALWGRVDELLHRAEGGETSRPTP